MGEKSDCYYSEGERCNEREAFSCIAVCLWVRSSKVNLSWCRICLLSLAERKICYMQTGDVSPWLSPRGSISSQDTKHPRNELDLIKNGPLSSLQSNGKPKIRSIAIALEGHKNIQPEPFVYAINHLVEQKNCRVVVICCMSRLQDPMGVDHPIDVKAFGGINPKTLKQAISSQLLNLNHFLNKKGFRAALEQKGVEIDIRIATGPKSEEILVQAAASLHPSWVVLDRSFSGHQKTLHAQLECNLVLMRKSNQLPELFKLNNSFLGPDRDEGPVEEPENLDMSGDFISSQSRASSSNANILKSGSSMSLNSSLRIHATNQTTHHQSTSIDQTFSCFTCLCLNKSGDLGDERHATAQGLDGPTSHKTVLFGEKATYLGEVGRPRTPQHNHQSAILSSTGSELCPTSPNGGMSKRTTSSKRVVKKLEAEMLATMKSTQEDDEADAPYYQVELC